MSSLRYRGTHNLIVWISSSFYESKNNISR